MSEELVTVEFYCPECKKTHYLKNIPLSKVVRVQNRRWSGEYIQDIFNDMKPSDREKFITGYCDKCQAKIFAAPED